jgi:hypothetical protein
VVTASHAHRETEDGEQGNEEGKSFLASSRAGAEDIGEREGVVHVVTRRWRVRLNGG